MRCIACWLGFVEYHEAYDLQKKVSASRLKGDVPIPSFSSNIYPCLP